MGEIKALLNPNIVFNGEPINQVIIKQSAQKHFGKTSTDILLYITSTLNGQNREPDEPSNDPERNVYKVASCVAVDNVPKISGYDYRDTYFNVDSERRAFIFFHSSQRNKKQYGKIPQKQKERRE